MKRKIFATADWHCGHDKCLIFDERPFDNIDQMHRVLIRRFNATVPKHGITYFLGDMGFRTTGLLRDIMNQLNGTKVLVRGNHDGGMYAMYEAGFDVVIDKAQIRVGTNIVTMTHCPLKGVFREDTSGMNRSDGTENWHGEPKHKNNYSIEDFGQFHLHGHIHSRKGKPTPTVDGRQMDVGVTAWNYTPVTLSQIESWITRYNNENKP